MRVCHIHLVSTFVRSRRAAISALAALLVLVLAGSVGHAAATARSHSAHTSSDRDQSRLVWTPAILPGISKSRSAQFFFDSAACPSRTSCFVVGSVYNKGSSMSVIEHFNGNTWTLVKTWLTSWQFVSVSCASVEFCMVVGSNDNNGALVEVDNHGRWTQTILPRPGTDLRAVACPKPGTCVVTGQRTSGFGVIESWEYSRHTWRAIPVHAGVQALMSVNSIACVNAANCQGVGYYGGGGPAGSGIIFHFDGHSWTRSEIQSMSTYRGGFGNVSCTPTGLCVATEDLSWPLSRDSDGLSGFFAQELVNGRWMTLGRGLPGPDQLVVAEGGVQCFDQGWCFVVGGSDHPMFLGTVTRRHLSPLALVRGVKLGVPSSPWLTDLACASPSFCVEASTSNKSPYVLVGRAAHL